MAERRSWNLAVSIFASVKFILKEASARHATTTCPSTEALYGIMGISDANAHEPKSVESISVI
jgi:hypothetical protein